MQNFYPPGYEPKSITGRLLPFAAKYAYDSAVDYFNRPSKPKQIAMPKRSRQAKRPRRVRRIKGNRGGVTNNYDESTQYVKSRMPSRKKRQWKKMIKKDRAMDMSKIATQIAIKNSSISQSIAAAAGTQAYFAVALKGNNGTVDNSSVVGMRDLYLIVNADNTGSINTNAKGFILSSAVLDITFTNTGSCPLEVDMYTCQAKRGNTHLADPVTEQGAAETSTPTIGTGSALALTQRGATPFDFPLWSRYGNQILKKQKFFVTINGGTFTSQMKDPRNTWMSSLSVGHPSGTDYTYKGITKYLFFVVKKVAGFDATAASFTCGATRRYAYKIVQNNTVGDMVV